MTIQASILTYRPPPVSSQLLPSPLGPATTTREQLSQPDVRQGQSYGPATAFFQSHRCARRPKDYSATTSRLCPRLEEVAAYKSGYVSKGVEAEGRLTDG